MPRRSIAALLAPFLVLIAAMAAPATLAGGGCHVPDGSVYMEGESTVIRMDTCSFAPTISSVPVGTTVRFLNTATNDHAVVGRAFGSDILIPGAEFSATFEAAGTYPYACPMHTGMVGAIVVGDTGAPGAPAPPAELASSVGSATTAETVPGVVLGLAGLGVGLLIGAVGAVLVVRRRRADPGR